MRHSSTKCLTSTSKEPTLPSKNCCLYSSIVLNGSIVALVGNPAASIYSATKAAINSLAKTLSRDLLHRKIHVTVVNPGSIATPGPSKVGVPAEAVPGFVEKMAAEIPIGRTGTVDEITGYVAFLLSDKSTFILGSELAIPSMEV